MTDRTVTAVAVGLVVVAVTAIAGIAITVATGGSSPTALEVIASAAVGALAGVLTPTRRA